MKKTITGLAWLSLCLVAALAALNWPMLLVTSPINLVVTEVRLPLGLFMLALAAVPLSLFFLAYLHHRISNLVETRGLLREVQRAHELADRAEASRVDGLRQLLSDHMQVISNRLDSLGAAPGTLPAPAVERPTASRTFHSPWSM